MFNLFDMKRESFEAEIYERQEDDNVNERENEYKHLGRERMISLADLFEEILRKIWLIIILAVVFAVLCAGYKYMSDRSKAADSVDTNSYEKAVSSLSDKEVLEVESVLDLYGDVEASGQYLDESIRMNIDPFHEDRVSLQYALQADSIYVPSLMQLFETYISGGGLGEDLQEYETDIEPTYLSELVSFVSVATGDTKYIEEQDEEHQAIAAFDVRVIGTDEDMAAQLADSVEKCMDSYAEELGSRIDSFKLTLVNRFAAQVYDSTLRTSQSSTLADQIAQQNNINTQTGNLSSTQVTVLDTMLAQESSVVLEKVDDVAGTQSTDAKVHISRRYVLLGVLIGIVIGVIVIILFYLARGALNIAQEFPGEFGIPVLGQVHEKKQKNPLVRAWRRLAYKKKPIPPETERQISVANLKAFCKTNGADRILLTGTGLNLTENASLQEIRTALSENGIEAEIAGGLLDLPDTLEQLSTYPYIALVETLHKSYYRNVVSEVEICEEQNVQIAGAIVLE